MFFYRNERINVEEENMKESLHKSIAEIMAFFDFKKVAEIE